MFFMQIETNRVPRKKFVIWLGSLALFSMIGGAFGLSKIKEPKTVKLLTRDGKLVEVDAGLLAAYRKKVSDKELLNWINRK